jgi:hypothetical protein
MADVIVNSLALDDLRVYVALRAHMPDCPMLLAMTDAERARHPILESLATIIPRDVSGAALVTIVEEATA